MPIQQVSHKILFHELPRSIGFLDSFVILCGMLMTGSSIYVYFYFPKQSIWMSVSIGLLGIFALLNPVIDLFRASFTATLDFALRQMIIEKKSIFKNVVEEYKFDDISRFMVEKDMSIDIHWDRWEVRVELKTGKQFLVPNSWTRDFSQCDEIVHSANKLLQ
jgi:hypothetical protein